MTQKRIIKYILGYIKKPSISGVLIIFGLLIYQIYGCDLDDRPYVSDNVRVVDGDTLVLDNELRIRLQGIDAPVALGKVDKLQLVKIQSTQSLTDSVEPNFTYEEVTNHTKLRGGMYWVVTKVKEVSSEIYNIVEADILWAMEGRIHNYAMVSNYGSTGILDHDTIQDGIYLNLGDPLRSYESEYLETSRQGQGLRKDAMEVGLTHSTLSMGKPCTWGRGQQYSVSLSTLNSLTFGG